MHITGDNRGSVSGPKRVSPAQLMIVSTVSAKAPPVFRATPAFGRRKVAVDDVEIAWATAFQVRTPSPIDRARVAPPSQRARLSITIVVIPTTTWKAARPR